MSAQQTWTGIFAMISIIPIIINFVPVTRGKSVYRGSDGNHKTSQLLGLKKVVWEPVKGELSSCPCAFLAGWLRTSGVPSLELQFPPVYNQCDCVDLYKIAGKELKW